MSAAYPSSAANLGLVEDDMTELTDDRTMGTSTNTDTSSSVKNLFRQVLASMNPVVCFGGGGSVVHGRDDGGGCVNPACINPLIYDEEEYIDYDSTIPPILNELKSEGKVRSTALQKLFKLTDKESHQHRVPVVCSKTFNTMEAVIPCLSPDSTAQDRRQALLLLNNLCIPQENKKHLLMGETRDSLLTALLQIFQKRLAEAHIAAACMYNLSFLEEAKLMLLTYNSNPTNNNGSMPRTNSAKSSYSFHSPSTSENSLLRIVEEMVTHFTPFMSKADEKKVSTVEAATIRWCMALMRNLATAPDNAAVVATTTKFPLLAAQYLQESNRDLVEWTRDSLEDSSLLFLLMLVQSGDDSCKAIDSQEVRIALQKVSVLPGIHGVRAGVILQQLDEANENEQIQAEQLMEQENRDKKDVVQSSPQEVENPPQNDNNPLDDLEKESDFDEKKDEEFDRGTLASF